MEKQLLKNLFLKFKNICLNYFREKKQDKGLSIPTLFNDNEKIIRAIFSPINIKENNGQFTIRDNAFKTPGGIDEVSVSRLSYTTIDFCKQHSKGIENPMERRSYFGFANLCAKEIIETDCHLEYSPIEENPFHANIKIGYIPQKGEQLPAEYSFKVKQLTKKARFYIDPNVNSQTWTGCEII